MFVGAEHMTQQEAKGKWKEELQGVEQQMQEQLEAQKQMQQAHQQGR